MSLDFTPSNCVRALHDVIGLNDDSYRQQFLVELFTKIVNNPIHDFSLKEKEVVELYLNGYEMADIARLVNRSLASTYRIYKRAVLKIGSVLKDLYK